MPPRPDGHSTGAGDAAFLGGSVIGLLLGSIGCFGGSVIRLLFGEELSGCFWGSVVAH